jgi:HupE / UreJ protein
LAALRPEQPTNESFVMKPTSKTEVLPVQHVRLRTLLHMTMALFVALLLLASPAFAHAVAEGDKGYIQEISGVNLIPFIYLGAKHMVTGYDHILFLFGVIFFLYKLKHIAIYVSLFALGHSLTLLFGVYFNIGINSYLIDAIIGLSVVYKAMDNMGAFQRWFGFQPDTKAATLIFGLCHGFGLSSKILDYDIAPDGLVPNLLAFNVGVEIGQMLALAAILIVMGFWRRNDSFFRHAYTANTVMMSAGFVLIGYQLTGYFIS